MKRIFNFKFHILNFKFSPEMRSGFTLMELLMYIGIISIVLLVLTNLFSSVLDVQLESESVSSLQQDGRYILNRMTNDIQNAGSISLPATLGTSSATLRVNINGQNYTYTTDSNGNLQLTNNIGTNNLNSIDTTISNFRVIRRGNSLVGDNTIDIAFTITSKVKRETGFETKNFQTNIGTRLNTQ